MALAKLANKKLKLSTQSVGYLKRFWNILRGSMVGQLILIAISPILSRLYSADEFGVLSFYLNIFGILAVAASLRLELAIPSARTGRVASQLTMLAMVSSIGLALLSIPVALTWAMVYRPGAGPNIATYWWCIPLGIFLMGASNALVAWGTYYRQYRAVGNSRLMQGVESASIQLAWPFLSAGPLGLILGTIVSQAGGFARLGARFRGALKNRPGLISPGNLWRVFRQFGRYPAIATPASLIGRAAVHIPGPMFLFLFDAKVAGFILITQRVIGVPTTLLGRAAATPFQQSLGEAKRKGKSALGIFLLTIGVFSVPGLAMVVGILALGPFLFALVFGQEWREAGVYAQVLAPMYFFQLLASPFAQAQAVVGKPAGQLLLESVRLLMVVGVILAAQKLSGSILVTLTCYSIVMCVVYTMYLVAAANSSRQNQRHEVDQKN